MRITGLTTEFLTAKISGNVATWHLLGIPTYAGRTGGPVGPSGGFDYTATFTGGVVSGSMTGDYQDGFYCVNASSQPGWSGTLSGFKIS